MFAGRRTMRSWWGLGLLGLASAYSLPAAGAQEARGATPAELVNRAKDTSAFPQARCEAIRQLGDLRDETAVSAHKVVDELVSLASDSRTDAFVREAAMGALANIQVNIYPNSPVARNRFQGPLVDDMMDRKESLIVRKAAIRLFGKTLDGKLSNDQRIYRQLLDLVEAKSRGGEVPLVLRREAAKAVAELRGFPLDDTLKAFVATLEQGDLDPQLREALLYALAEILPPDLEKAKGLDVLVPRLRQMVENKKLTSELRAQCLKILVKLQANGLNALPRDTIERMLKASDTPPPLVVAAVESVALLTTEDTVSLLKTTYNGYFDPGVPDRPADVRIRKAVVDTLGFLLSRAAQPGGNTRLVGDIVAVLLKMLDPEKKECGEVCTAAVFSLRYLNPPALKEYQLQAAKQLGPLLFVENPSVDKNQVMKTLETITQAGIEEDVAGWERWYTQTFHQPVPKPAPAPVPPQP